MKKFLSLALACVICLSLAACSATPDPDLLAARTPTHAAGSLTQEDFIANLWAGLDARYSKEVQDEDALSTHFIVEKAETDRFESYTFTDPQLEEAAKRYFAAMDAQSAAVDAKDQNAYADSQGQRNCAIRDINALYPLPAGDDAYYLERIVELAGEYEVANAVDQLMETEFPKATLVHKGNFEYAMTLTNTPDVALNELYGMYTGITPEGKKLEEPKMTFFLPWEPGTQQEATVRFEEEVAQVEVSLSYFANFEEQITDPVTLPVENNMKIHIEMPELPAEFNTKGFGTVGTTCRVEEIQVDQGDWIFGEAQVELLLAAVKTYDVQGADSDSPCLVGLRFYDAEDNMLKETTFIGDGMEGEILKAFPVYIGELAPGSYRVELFETE